MVDSGSDLSAELVELARDIIKEAADSPLDLRVDVLKAVTTLHLGLAKNSAKLPGDESGDSGLPAMRERIRQASEGK